MKYFVRVKKSWIDDKANVSATSHKNDTPQPSIGQIKSGNYKKGHISIHGMNITIENPKGSYRRGVDRDGKAWKVKLNHHYGYLLRSIGSDNDHVDCFLGNDIQNKENPVFIVNQVDPKSGKFDEHKVMLGFKDMKSAKAAYLSNYADGWKGLGAIKETSIDLFREWVMNKKETRAVFKALTSEGIQPLRLESFANRPRARKYKKAVKAFSERNPGADQPHHIKKMERIVKYFEKHYGKIKL